MKQDNKKRIEGAVALVSFLIACVILKAQELPPPPPPPPASASDQVSKADSLLRAGSIKSAIAEYNKMYIQNRNDRKIVYNYACALSLAGQADSALVYLYKAMNIDPSVSFLTDPDLLSVREESRGWKEFENELISAINKRTDNSIKDVAYAKSLWRLLCLDQSKFYETGIAVRNLGPDSPVVTALRMLQSWQNEKNLTELEALIDLKGWPKKSQVGSQAASAAFIILQHSNAGAQEKYIGVFEAACRNNEGNWQQYALMFDRMRMNQNKPQRYGTHNYLDPAAGNTNELYPLEDESRVDEWRKEIGLEPLQQYLKRSNISYKPGKGQTQW